MKTNQVEYNMEGIMVSVICLTYNHEKYIRQCLEGFIMQKTSFRFEVLIHDDASTDRTAAIIREYEAMYPDIIKPVYQTENQYSKHVHITKTFLLPNIRGKYIAWCEGDDCWTDEKKLQIQIDFLEKNKEYACCLHNVLFEKVSDHSFYYMPGIKIPCDFTANEIIRRGVFLQISSLVFRTSLYIGKPSCFSAKGFGDWPLFIYGSICGKLHVLPEVMSKYRNGTEGSWTNRIRNSKPMYIDNQLSIIDMLKQINSCYPNTYSDSISYALSRAEYNIYKVEANHKEMKKKIYRPFLKMDKRKKRNEQIRRVFPFLVTIKRKLKHL